MVARNSITPRGVEVRLPSRRPVGTFTASCGLARGNAGSVVFVVRGDGEELFRSDTVKDFGEHPVELDVSGVQSLELVAEDGGDGKNSDHACWFIDCSGERDRRDQTGRPRLPDSGMSPVPAGGRTCCGTQCCWECWECSRPPRRLRGAIRPSVWPQGSRRA
jgi:hypothetical protein